MTEKAVILLSGGLDSLTCLAIAQSEGYECYALTISYGQRHSSELLSAKHIAETYHVTEHKILTIPIHELGGSALTTEHIAVPDYKDSTDIPVTYVPARNTIFIAFALGYAEVVGASTIIIGASSVDYSHYSDCRPEYYEAFSRLAPLTTKAGVEGRPIKLYTPLLYLSKAETVKRGMALGVDYSASISCYRASPTGHACGTCDSCTFRKKGFREANIADPTIYTT